jgi:DNA-binding NarL/FixJ family response regulator
MTDRPRLLCIEDHAGTRELLVEVLEEAGFHVTTAADGAAGLAAALTRRHDLILCDVDLPVHSGFDLLEQLSAAGPELRALPFIFLTAYGQRANQLRARRLNCDDYIVKPIDFELLIAVIHSRLKRASDYAAAGSAPPAAAAVGLTDREIEALGWAARGKSTTDIAVLMAISERTVKFHIDNVIRKLNVSSRTQAAAKAAVMGLIKVP